MRRRGLLLAAVVVCGIAGLAAGIVLAVELLSDRLPSGNRTWISGVDPSYDEVVRGRYWYDRTAARALAAELAAATEGTNWCLGWQILLTWDDYVAPQADIGSSRGPDQAADECARWVQLEVTYAYTSATSSREDNAALDVAASEPAVAQALRDHPAYQITASDLLREDRELNDSDVIGNAIAGLPLVLAEIGELDPLTVQPMADSNTDTNPNADANTSADTEADTDAGAPSETDGGPGVTFADREGEGGSDLWHANGRWILGGLAAVLLGAAAVLYAWGRFPVTRAGFAQLARPGGLSAPSAPINPRRALKLALARSSTREEHRVAGPSDR